MRHLPIAMIVTMGLLSASLGFTGQDPSASAPATTADRPSPAGPHEGWNPDPVGTPPPSGEFSEPKPGTVELRGATGFAVRRPLTGDPSRASGSNDCTWVLRIIGLEGSAAVEVVPQDGDPPASPGTDTARAVAAWRAGERKGEQKGYAEEPLWVRVAVKGRNVGFYQGSDGVRWLNRMGGRTLEGQGPLALRLRIVGGRSGGAGMLRIEVVSAKSGADIGHRTDWFGNSLPGSVHDTVSFNMTALAVAADGTCYTTSSFEEQGHCIAAYRDGRQVAPDDKTPSAGRAVAVTDDAVFVASERGILRLDRSLRPQGKVVPIEDAKDYKGHGAVRGFSRWKKTWHDVDDPDDSRNQAL